jgi:hypothetical protein
MPGKALLTGEIYLARSTPAKLAGRVEAPDAEAATEAAAKEFGADPKRSMPTCLCMEVWGSGQKEEGANDRP